MAVIEKVEARASPAARSGPAWPDVHELAVWLAVVGWTGLVLMWATGSAGRFGHDRDGLPPAVALGLFLVGWVVMVAAMMLPWSLPTRGQLRPSVPTTATGAAAATFMAGFFFAWGLFGAAVFAGDVIVHLAVETIPWLAPRPYLIGGGVAVVAGAAELWGRKPRAWVSTSPDDAGPWATGRAHGVDQIRHCWPLMLFSMAAGMTSPAWMVGLTLAMALKLRRRAPGVVRLLGVGLVGLGAAVAVNPGWMPGVLETAGSAT